MKRTAAFLLAVAICVGTTATAFATEETVKDSASTEFQFTLRNDPSYTITIPAHVTMEQEGTDVEVLAEDVQDLGEDQKISVTIAGTDYYRNQMVLEDPETRGTMRYQIVTPDGRTLETTGEKDQMNGQEIVSFTGDGKETYTVKPVSYTHLEVYKRQHIASLTVVYRRQNRRVSPHFPRKLKNFKKSENFLRMVIDNTGQAVL